MKLKLGIYISLLKVISKTTGVGKHTTSMINSLLSIDNVEILLFGSYEIKHNKDYLFQDLEFYSIPFSTRILELSWKLFRYPYIDQYIPEVDAIYVPGEELVCSKKYKIYFTIHDVYQFTEKPISIRKYLLKKSYSRYLKDAFKIITVSNFSKNEIIDHFKLKSKDILVTGNGLGLDIENFKKMNSEIRTKNQIVIGGPIHNKKGGKYILKLCEELNLFHPSLKVFITGGIDKSYVNKFQKLNLMNTKVFKKAELEDNELISLISESICFVQLSIYEGFGITVLESLALGTPTIINDTPSLRSTFESYSVLIKSNKTNLIIDNIIRFRDDIIFRNKNKNLSSEILSKHSWKYLSFKLINFINEVN